jgi:predicted transcriptional regulator
MQRTAQQLRERVTINLSADLRQRIETIARAEHRSISNAITHLLEVEASRRLPPSQRTEHERHEAAA